MAWAVVVVVVMTSPPGGAYMGGRCPEEMRNSTRLSLSWNTSVMSTDSPKYCWRSAAHCVQKRSKRSAVSSPVPQWGQIGGVICPMKAWYKAVDVSLLSLSWWIALCACHGTPGGILELSWLLQHLKCQLAVPFGLIWAVFSNSLYHDCTANCCKCWDELSCNRSNCLCKIYLLLLYTVRMPAQTTSVSLCNKDKEWYKMVTLQTTETKSTTNQSIKILTRH